MSSNSPIIKVEQVAKCFTLYDQPKDRLKQFLYPRVQRVFRRDVKKYYQEFWALRNISFEVVRGEMLGIVGSNGSGKSTLLQIICGTLNPSGGNSVAHGSIAALLELGSGFNPEFSGLDNVYFYGQILGLTTAQIKERLPDILEFADIGMHIDQPVKTYSSGMMVRLAFAVSIAREPDILVVDEALAVGDESFQRKCYARINQLKDQGATILFVSHATALVVQLCDRVILLDKGELLDDGPPKSVVTKYQKLIFAPKDKKQQLREQIKSGEELCVEAAGTKTVPSKVKPDVDNAKDLESFLVPEFISKSLVEYESQGAIISKCRIETVDGKIVNHLFTRRRYTFVFEVVFEQSVDAVQFGMLIKNKAGFEFGGAVYPSIYDTAGAFSAGENVEVRIDFSCLLNPGIYFFNAGLTGENNGYSGYLHRMIDALIFKVESDTVLDSSGYVNFDINSSIKLVA